MVAWSYLLFTPAMSSLVAARAGVLGRQAACVWLSVCVCLCACVLNNQDPPRRGGGIPIWHTRSQRWFSLGTCPPVHVQLVLTCVLPAAPHSRHPFVCMAALPVDVRRQLTDLADELANDEITVKGYRKKRSKALAKYAGEEAYDEDGNAPPTPKARCPFV